MCVQPRVPAGRRPGRPHRRTTPYFMWYDWMAGGWGGRASKDGSSATAPVFGPGLAVQPVEGQERLSPVLTTRSPDRHRLRRARPIPRRAGHRKGRRSDDAFEDRDELLLRPRPLHHLGYRRRPALHPARRLDEQGHRSGKVPRFELLLVPLQSGDSFTRPSAGGGGYGDPLERTARRSPAKTSSTATFRLDGQRRTTAW